MICEQPELIQVKESLSPREAWLRRFEIVTGYLPAGTETSEGIVDEGHEWAAIRPGVDDAPNFRRRLIETGPTEHVALCQLAKMMGVPLWFEEAYVAFGPSRAMSERGWTERSSRFLEIMKGGRVA